MKHLKLKNWKQQILFSITFFIISCNTTDPDKSFNELIEKRSTTHLNYHFSTGDKVDTLWQEKYIEWLLSALKVNIDKKLEYFKYRDKAHLQLITGKNTNGFAEIGTYNFHTIWQFDNHECVHSVVINKIGWSPALFNEGIAVAHQVNPLNEDFIPKWNMKSVHDHARDFKRANQIPLLVNVIESVGFFNFDTNMSYPMAGSFVKYLLDMYGLDKLKSFFAISNFYDLKEKTEQSLYLVYGKSLSSIWNEWLGWL